MMSILLISGIILLIVVFLVLIFIFLPWAFGAPFDPSSRKEVEKIIKLANVKKGEKVVDLGSGEGRVVIGFARRGIEAHGYEINPLLVWLSRRKIKKAGLEGLAFVHKKNFWSLDFGNFDVIVLFQVSYVMRRLAEKIKKECKKDVRIVSNTWKFPGKEVAGKDGNVYLYRFND